MLENIVLLLAGGLTGFGLAVAISRNKFARIQAEARSRYQDLLTELGIERDLNEGLAQELDAVASRRK